MKKVLFICVHNSARSQMAEEFLRRLGKNKFEVESSGFEPTQVNPLVIKAMAEDGMDLSQKQTQSVFDLYKAQKFFGYIITVCDKAKEKDCPVFPGVQKRLHWNLEDPEDFTGTEDEKLEKVRLLRDKIKGLVLDFIAEN